MTSPALPSEAEARDAYIRVEMTLTNGRKIKVRPPLFDEAMPILLQLDGFLKGQPFGESLLPALKAFEELTGVPARELTAGQVTMDVFKDLQRFFYLPRPGSAEAEALAETAVAASTPTTGSPSPA